MPVTQTGQLKYMSRPIAEGSTPKGRPKPIIAQFIKSDRCSAEGLEVRANAPALAMCRKLLEAGYDPDRPLHCFRGETLAMKISSIAYGARYSVSEPLDRLGSEARSFLRGA